MNDKQKKLIVNALADALDIKPSQIDVKTISLDDLKPECLHTLAIFDLLKYMAYELAHDEDGYVDFWCSNLLAVYMIRSKAISDCHAWQTIVDDFHGELPLEKSDLVGRHDRLKRKLEMLKARTAEHESED